MTKKDNTSLFSGRVQNYIKYRPTYPPALIEILKARCDLTPDKVIADVGSGTGILSELFLINGNKVYGVEPNAEMRDAAEKILGPYPNFTSVGASAEATTIRSHSVDIITAGQAFHWFNPPAAHAEFIRILKPRGWVTLIWNRAHTNTPFEKEYDEFWRVELRGAHEARDGYEALIQPFFGDVRYERVMLEGVAQVMNQQEFIGRILSISAAVQPNEPGYDVFLQKIQDMFERYQQDNRVRLSYDTEIYFGRLVM